MSKLKHLSLFPGKGQGLIRIYELKGTSERDGETIWRVKYKGYPTPTFDWYRGDNKILSDHNKNGKYEMIVTKNTITLKIRNISRNDSGIYTLKAYNGLFKTEKSFPLNVTGLSTFFLS